MGSETFLEKIPSAPFVDMEETTNEQETQKIEPSEVGPIADVLPELAEKAVVRAATASEDELMESIGKAAVDAGLATPETLQATEVAAAKPKQGEATFEQEVAKEAGLTTLGELSDKAYDDI